jgi:hypothetical protein
MTGPECAALSSRWRRLAIGMRDQADQLEEEARGLERKDPRRHVGFCVAHELRTGCANILHSIEETPDASA